MMNPDIVSADKFFKSCYVELGGELTIAFQYAIDQMVKLNEEQENFIDMQTYREVVNVIRPSAAKASQLFRSLVVGEKVLKSVEKRKGQQLTEDDVLQFHNDDLNLVTHDELDYQLQLEGAFSDTRRKHEAMLFEAGMDATGKSFVGNNPVREHLEHIRPGRLALYLQAVFDGLYESTYVSRIAFRFVGWFYFQGVMPFYGNWHPEVKKIADKLGLRQTLSLMPQDDGHEEDASSDSSADAPPIPPVVANALVGDGEGGVDEKRRAAMESLTKLDLNVLNQRVSKFLENIESLEIPARFGKEGESLEDEPGDSLSSVNLFDLSPDTKVETLDSSGLDNLLSNLQEERLTGALAGSLDEGGAAGEGCEAPPGGEGESEGNSVRSVLKNALTGMSGENIMTVIDRVSENIINLVSHLFENITENPELNSDVGFQVARAQLPVMRLALSDTALFQSNDHPARQFINKVGDLGLKVSSTEEEGFHRIRDWVDRLLEGFNGEQGIFEELNGELEQYLDSEEGVVYQEEEISEEAVQEQYAEKPQAVQEYLGRQDKLIKREFMFHRFSKLVWDSLLSRIEEDKGTESLEWKMATNTYTEMIWSTQIEAKDDGAKQQILRRIPKIVNSVRKLFYDNGMSDGVREAILNYMFRIHMQIVKGTPLLEIEDDFGRMLGGESLQERVERCTQVDILNVSAIDESVLGIESEGKRDLDRADPSLAYKYAQENTESIDFGEVHVDAPVENPQSGSGADEREDKKEETHSQLPEPPSRPLPVPGNSSKERDVEQSEVPLLSPATPSELADGLFTGQEELAAAFDETKTYKVGELFELQREELKHRYQLTHVSNIFGKYTFREFGTRGLLEISKPDLVIEILRGTITKLSSSSLFDNSLESVISQIQSGDDEGYEEDAYG